MSQLNSTTSPLSTTTDVIMQKSEHSNVENEQHTKDKEIDAEPFVVPTFSKLSLSDLIEHVHKELSKAKPDMRCIDAIMRAYDVSLGEYKRYVHWNPAKKYTRNLIATDDETFTLMLLCWNSAIESPIHNHSGSECFMRVLEGSIVESKYHLVDKAYIADNDICAVDESSTSNNNVSPVRLYSNRKAPVGAVLFINDSIGVHKIENPFPEPAVTLHCYLPPYESCLVYDECSKDTVTSYVTFDTDPYGDFSDYH